MTTMEFRYAVGWFPTAHDDETTLLCLDDYDDQLAHVDATTSMGPLTQPHGLHILWKRFGKPVQPPLPHWTSLFL
jgi:hypothetical protein